MNLSSKVVLITGASSGIGKACAEAFAEHGSFLAIAGRDSEALKSTKTKCCQLGVEEKNVLLLLGDLADDKVCERFVESTVQHFGRVNVLVNNAGMALIGSVETLSMERFDRIMNVNLRSAYLLTKLCIPHLIKTKGNIVNMSSMAGIKPVPGGTAYSISKAALDMLTKCASLEVADKGVRVNSVNPGIINTNIFERTGLDEETRKQVLEKCKTIYPLCRSGEPREVAASVLFLASDQSSFITGICLPIDGGFNNASPSL